MHPDGVTGYREEEFLLLSGLQHFLFCRRQWGLIYIEQLWAENLRTVSGTLLHERAHGEAATERRGDTIITRGMPVFSRTLGVSVQCDVLEFHRDEGGVPLSGLEGKWRPFPVEYKRGAPKDNECDAAQLCGQALCLEEMLCCEIPDGALFYGESRRRTPVVFTPALRELVRSSLAEMHELYRRGYTPRVRPTKSCNACSLKELCLPAMRRAGSVSDYLKTREVEE